MNHWQRNDQGDAIQYRFEHRLMTREEYEHWTHKARRARYEGWAGHSVPPCTISKPSYLMTVDERESFFTSHIDSINDHMRQVISPHTHPAEWYSALTENYRNYVAEMLSDYYGSLWEAEIERRASHYHMFGHGGGLIIG
jgi:hypothetical protein